MVTIRITIYFKNNLTAFVKISIVNDEIIVNDSKKAILWYGIASIIKYDGGIT